MIDKYKNKIVCGDSIEMMKKIPEKSIDLVFADPPYWMQTTGKLERADGTGNFSGVNDDWDKFENYKQYDIFTEKWIKEVKRILKDEGSFWVIGAFQNIFRIANILQKYDFWIINDVVWHKSNATPNFRGTRLKNEVETLLWVTKNKKSKYTFNYKTMKYLNQNKQLGNVWKIPICSGKERLKDEEGKKIHNTQKPEKLLEKIILASSKPDDIVLDPFSGTGTTACVAKRLKRNFIGFEKDKKYVKTSKERLDKVKVSCDDVCMLQKETKPPKVSVEKLIELNFLNKGQTLYDKKGEKKAILNKSGKVLIDDQREEISIHKASAKILNKENNNGWSFFWVYFNGVFMSIDELRYIYARGVKNEE